MKERPILFSAPMVRALLAGTKTQTRRVIKDQQIGERFCDMRPEGAYLEWLGTPSCGTGVWDVPEYSGIAKVPFGVVGDLLWVREAHAFSVVDHEGRDWRDDPENWDVIYRADPVQPAGGWRDSDGKVIPPPWRPSIHMPRWASRITLEVTGVRVERLQDIRPRDILAEGAVERPHVDQFGRNPVSRFDGKVYLDLRSLWAAGWNQINGPGSWDANPWVWVIEFRRT